MGFKPRATASRLGQLYGVDLSRGGWGSAQIVRTATDKVRLAALDWFGEHLPSVADLRGRQLLVQDHHSWTPSLLTRNIEDLPGNFTLIGTGALPTVAKEMPRRNEAGHFELQMRLQQRWLRVPEAARIAYKDALDRRQQDIQISLGPDAPAKLISAGRTQVHVVGPVNNGPSPITIVGPSANPDWTALDALGALNYLSYAGDDLGLITYLENKPMIAQLGWSSETIEKLDLRKTHLTSVGVNAGRLTSISLPSDCETLRLGADVGAVSVRAYREGAVIDLTVSEPNQPLARITGLTRIHKLNVNRADEFDCAELLCFPDVEHIALYQVSRLRSVHRLTELTKLRRLEIYQCYDFDGDRFPIPADWPGFLWMSIDGCRKTDAIALKQRNAKDKRLELRGAKTDVWLKANVGNPFRDWSDHHIGRKAKTASKAYADAIKALAADHHNVQTILRTFVEVFNAMDDKDGVDTADREDIWDAYTKLVDEAPTAVDNYEQLFDDWREF